MKKIYLGGGVGGGEYDGRIKYIAKISRYQLAEIIKRIKHKIWNVFCLGIIQ